MRSLSLTALVSCLVLGSSHAEEAKPAAPAFEKIPLTLSDKTGHCLGLVHVEGQEGRFLVDSGAGTVAVLSSSFAQSLGALIDFGSYSLAVPSSSVAEANKEYTPKP